MRLNNDELAPNRETVALERETEEADECQAARRNDGVKRVVANELIGVGC